MLHEIVASVLHTGRPELLARGLIGIIDACGASRFAIALKRRDDSSVEILASSGQVRNLCASVGDGERRLELGAVRGGNIELILQPKPDAESMATINAASLLVTALLALERAHSEREKHSTLWPVEEVQSDDRGLWIGHMRERLSRAKRIAEYQRECSNYR